LTSLSGSLASVALAGDGRTPLEGLLASRPLGTVCGVVDVGLLVAASSELLERVLAHWPWQNPEH